MQRGFQVPNATSTYNSTNQRIYTRFHRKPQIYPSSFKMNKKDQKNTLEQENMNNLISDIYKHKKFRGILDPTSPNNKNIFIDTDSEIQKSQILPEEYQKIHSKKSTQLLIAKTESQFPETYNARNIFTKDGIIKGYYIKVNPKKDYNTYDDNYNYIKNAQNRNEGIKTVFQTPDPEIDENIIYNYNPKIKTLNRPKKEGYNYFNYTDNANFRRKKQFGKENGEEECPHSLEPISKNNKYYKNKDIQLGINPVINKINRNQQNNQGMIYKKNNISYSKSNISDVSLDLLNQQKKQQNENNILNNYIIPGTDSNIISPQIDYKNISNENEEDINSDELDHQNELLFYNEPDYNNSLTKNVIRKEINGQRNNIPHNQGGKVDLYFELINNKKDNNKRDIYSITGKNRLNQLERMIDTDEYKYNSLIKLQRFIKSYLYLREICAMKIQAVWRGCNTRKIMDLYNNLDEFIYHLSKVQFNHFNNDFCYFIKQLFNIYKANISNGNYNDVNDELENNENDININNEMMDDEPMMERGVFFDPEKLETENEIALVVEGEINNNNRIRTSKDYDKLKRDYDDLYQQYNQLKNNKNNIIITDTNKRVRKKKEKNESESTIGSMKSGYKFRFRTNSRDKTNYRGYSEVRHSADEKGKNSFSNDYDADLDINREDDFFNQEISYDEKDGSPIQNQYNYFNVNSEENSKYFDNENIKEDEINNKYNNNAGKYTTKRGKYKNKGINKLNQNNINSPSIEKTTNYIGLNSKTFQRRQKYSDDNSLIIPKREEEFNIIDNKGIFSPKVISNTNNNKDILITPINRFTNKTKNWNEINEHIKNEEISYKNKNQNDFIKIIDNKDNEINLLQKKLNEVQNSVQKQKIFNNNLEINNKLNEINIKGNKSHYIELNKIESNGNNNQKKAILRNKSESHTISLRNEINIKGSKIYKIKENNKFDEIIKNSQFSLINKPKREIRIVTKKILKKTNYIHSRFKDNKTKISSQNEIDIRRTIKNNTYRIFSEENNKMSNENILNLRGIGKRFDNVKINKNNIESINLEGNQIPLKKRRLIPNKTYDNIINRKSQFKLEGKKPIIKENIINRKTQFKIEGIKKDLSEKDCDTNDLMPKEIKITTKKVIKKTNIIKPKIRNEISLRNEVRFEGTEEQMDKIEQKEYIQKKKEWKNLLQPEVQHNKFIIKRISKNIYNKIKERKEKENKFVKNNKENLIDNHININIEGLDNEEDLYKNEVEKHLNKSLRIENANKHNIIVKKINLKIISNHYNPQEKSDKGIINLNNWNALLKEESLQSKFTIKRKKSKPIKKEIQKNIEITIGPTKDISKAKEKILENWKELNSEEKLEEFNIEKQPQQRQIKITTKKILKKTNYIYKKFTNESLNITNNQLNIKGKEKMKSSEFTSENSKIDIKINEEGIINKKSYENELKVSNGNEIFINKDNYKKKEIKITTKMSITKTKFIYKRFQNNYISYENQINIKRQKPKVVGLGSALTNLQKPLEEQENQKKENIKKVEKTTDTLDLERKEIKITTKKVVKKTNILKHKFNNTSICENDQLIINKTHKEKENDIINKINNFKINKNKINNTNIINKVSEIYLCKEKWNNNNYNISNKINDENNKINETKLHSKKNKKIESEKSMLNDKKTNKDKKLKTVVVYIDKKYDLKNCFDKWNNSTINLELKNEFKNIPKTEINKNKEIKDQNKTTEEITDFETINIEDNNNSNMNTKSSNNDKKEGKKRKIKIKYVKNNKDNSINSDNKLSISDEMSSNNDNENKTIKYRNDKGLVEEAKEMKSLDPKSTKKPFILRINKVEVKKKILKSNSKTIKNGENDKIKNDKIMSQINSLLLRHFLKRWQQNKVNDIYLQKSIRRFIIRAIILKMKIQRFKIFMIKYALKNK